MQDRLKLFSLFLLSIAIITYELFIIRSFSLGSWSNFGSLVISTALLGFGVSGTLLTFMVKKVKEHPNRWMIASSMLFIPSMAAAHIIAQNIPFNPIFIGSDPHQFLWIGLYYLVYGTPFFFGALFIGVTFITLDTKIYQLYFWNMLGSGLGGLLIIFLMYWLSPDSLIIPVLLLAFFANLFCSLQQNRLTGKLEMPARTLVASSAAIIVSLVAVFLWGEIHISEYKPISYIRKYPDVKEIHHSYSPVGEIYVYSSSFLHFAPGLSDNAILQLDQLPRQPFWGLYIDGNGPIGIMGKMKEEEAAYMDFLPMAGPYTVLDKPKVLLVNLGGGISAQVAKYKGARDITIFEKNPEIVRLMHENPAINAFTGNFFDDPQIHVNVGDARAHSTQNPDTYDLVEISLIDSIGLSDSGGYPIQENYTYTQEAISEYMMSLNEEGILSITVWNRLRPPRNVLKLLTSIVQSMQDQGIENPEKRLFMYDLFLSTATILIKKSDFTEGEIYDLRQFCRRRSFDVSYYPGIQRRDKDFEAILNVFRNHFEFNRTSAERIDFTPSDVYHFALLELLNGATEKLYQNYIFDIRPMHDSRPYYSGYLKLNKVGMYLDKIRDISEEWGYLLLIGILIQSIVLGIFIVLIPIAGRWRELFKKQQGTLGVIVYFACLGVGYMFMEIFLIQKLVFLLNNPIYSVSIVITSMLIISGLGNLASKFVNVSRKMIVRIAGAGIVLTIAFYFFGLGPLLNSFRNSTMAIRIIVSVLIITPSAFFLGIPFPNGLNSLTEHKPRLLPWAWGMNGGLSVTGTALAWILSVGFGFHILLITIAALYIIVGIIFPANEFAYRKT